MALEFVQEFFCKPIQEYSGYNPINTIVYGAILLGIAFLVVYPYFNRNKIKFDEKFLLALIPFIVFGSTFRIFEDLRVFSRSCNPFEFSFYTITPGVYILVGLLTIAALIVSIFLARKTKFSTLSIFRFIGILLALIPILFLVPRISQWLPIIGIVLLAGLLVAIATFLTRRFESTKALFGSRFNQLILFGQVLDGSATFTAIQFFNFGEQHVVSNAIILIFGPIGFLVAKFIIAILILHYIDKEIENENLRGFVKIFLAIIGFAPGIRDAWLIGAGLGN